MINCFFGDSVSPQAKLPNQIFTSCDANQRTFGDAKVREFNKKSAKKSAFFIGLNF
jgi:hypothetical protein